MMQQFSRTAATMLEDDLTEVHSGTGPHAPRSRALFSAGDLLWEIGWPFVRRFLMAADVRRVAVLHTIMSRVM